MTINATRTKMPSLSLHSGSPSLHEIPMEDPRTFLREPYASMPTNVLLDYFRERNNPQYFPLPHGSLEHVERADRILKNEFNFNNEAHRLPDSFDWKVNPSRDLEWLILLHKFYYTRDLAAAYDFTREERYATKWTQLVSSWIREVPEGFIDSQVTGRRLQQWLLAYHYFVPRRRSPTITPPFLVEFIRSVHAQALYLSEHLTPEGNHRTIELYAIFLVAVVFPELKESDRLLKFSQQELLGNMEEDLLADGVQRELSTDYHHTVLKNYLHVKELAVLNKIALSPRFDELITRAVEFSIYIHKPDGLIPAINDADSCSYLSLLKKAYLYYPNAHLLYVISKGKEGTPPPERCKAFSISGYYILRGNWTSEPYEDGLYLLFDCGPIGFGSHGHYDLLNIEAAAFGHSLIVDPGRYTYSEDSADGINWRRIFKGTAYHNTVVVDKKDQIPYRPGKPMEPEPRTSLRMFATAHGFDFIHAQAVSQEYPVVHERMVFFAVPEYWIVTDLMRGKGSHTYDQFWHLSPMAQGQATFDYGNNSIWVRSPHLLIGQPQSSDIQSAIQDGFVSPTYGVRHNAPIATFSQNTEGIAFFHTVLYPYQTDRPILDVERLPVRSPNRQYSKPQATALRITIRSKSETFSDYLFVAHEQPVGEYGFADIECRSHILFLRRDHAGRIVNLQAEGLERLRIGTNFVTPDIGVSRRVSYNSGQLHMPDSDRVGHDRMGALLELIQASQK